MRKLGKQITQKGSGKRVKKSANQLLAEIQKKKKTKKSDLAKTLGISDRTLRSYKKYFASLDNPEIRLSKNDRKPPKKILDKISKIATNKKIKKTRSKGAKFDKSRTDELTTLISDSTWKRLQQEMKKSDWFGWLIRINILFITKEGSFDNWVTYLTSIKTKGNLNNFLSGEIQKLVESKNSILGFEILEVVIDTTLQIKEK